jgi:hypothetical protein
VNLAVGVLIVLGAAALAFALIALVRRGGRPVLGNPARGTPTAVVAGTTNAVLLAFVILAAFQNYDGAKAGAATEANAVLEMARTAALFPAAQRDRQAATRTTGRQQRLSDDTPTVPTPLWLALVLTGCVAVALQLVMADPQERLSVQGLQLAGVAAIVATGLLIINFLDHPYAPHIGGIQPNAMRHTLGLARNLEPALNPRCTSIGRL